MIEESGHNHRVVVYTPNTSYTGLLASTAVTVSSPMIHILSTRMLVYNGARSIITRLMQIELMTVTTSAVFLGEG